MQTGLGRVRLLPHTEGLARGRSVRPLVPLVALIPRAPVQACGANRHGELEAATTVIGGGAPGRRGILVGQVEVVVAVRVPAGEGAPGAAVPQRSGSAHVVIPAVPQGVGWRARVLRRPPGDRPPVPEAAACSLHRERPVGLTVAAREPSRHTAVDEGGPADPVRQVRFDDVDHAPESIRSVQHARGTADHLDPR